MENRFARLACLLFVLSSNTFAGGTTYECYAPKKADYYDSEMKVELTFEARRMNFREIRYNTVAQETTVRTAAYLLTGETSKGGAVAGTLLYTSKTRVSTMDFETYPELYVDPKLVEGESQGSYALLGGHYQWEKYFCFIKE